MKKLLIILSLVTLLSVNNAASPMAIPHFMQCAQSLLGGLDILSLMGEHLEENNYQILEASIRAFAYQVTMMKAHCGIQVASAAAQAHFDQNKCFENTKAFYANLKPLAENPQDLLTDASTFQGAMDSFANVLDTCGVDLDDEENEKLDKIIEDNGGIDLAALLPIMEIYNNQRGGGSHSGYPSFGRLQLEDS